MKCVCRNTCQVRLEGGQIKFFKRGEVWEFDQCPAHFEPIEVLEAGDVKIVPLVDFAIAQEEELLNAEYDLEELRTYLKDTYGKVTSMTDKEKLVAMLLDARFRAIS